MPEIALPIENKKGLHARAAAKFVKMSAAFPMADIHVIGVERDGEREDVRVLATSVLGLLMLAAELGSTLYVRADGADADAALLALKSLVQGKFEEGE